MATAGSDPPQRTQAENQGILEEVKGTLERAEEKASPLIGFWTKLSNDWVFNFSGTLAYGLLTAIFPILLVIIAIGGLLLGAISPDARTQLENAIAEVLPGGATGAGGEIVRAATRRLYNSAPGLLAIGVVTALIGGSSLFITMEGIFGVVFRLRSREFFHQRLMAIGMLLLFAVLIPLIMLASIVPPAVLGILGIGNSSPLAGFFIQLFGLVVAFTFAVALFGAIYIVVPNKPMNLRMAWKGTLVAATLLVLYEILFPLYESNFLHADDYGALIGFIVVVIVFFYYLAFILLLGAEVNSWALGQRQTAAPIQGILHELQVHNTTQGAAGPTAGQPQEDLLSHKGAMAVLETQAATHQERKAREDDVQPPSYAESGRGKASYRLSGDQTLSELCGLGGDSVETQRRSARPGGTGDAERLPISMAELRRRRLELTHPIALRERRTLIALAVAGGIVVAGVIRFVGRLLARDDHPSSAAD